MDTETQLPLSLMKMMNTQESLATLQSFGDSTEDQLLRDALKSSRHVPYDAQRAKFVETLENVELRGLIEEHKRMNQADPFWANFSTEVCTWQQVREELQKSELKYSQGKSLQRSLRRGVRQLTTITPLLESLPEEKGLGLIKGGIMVVVNVIKQRSDACDKIFSCFRTIPDDIRWAQETLHQFRSEEDSSLYSCANQFHFSIIGCLPELIKVLLRQTNESKFKQYGKAPFVNQVADVDELIKPITVARVALEQRIANLRERRQHKAAKQLDTIRSENMAMRQTVHQHHYENTQNHHETAASIRSVHHTTERTFDGVQALHSRVDGAVDTLGQQIAQVKMLSEQIAPMTKTFKQLASLLPQLQIVNNFHMMTQDQERNREYDSGVSKLSPQYLEASPPLVLHIPDSIRLEQLLPRIQSEFEIACHTHDLVSVVQQYQSFGNKALSQAAHLSEKDEFRNWLLGQGPGILLVDGRCAQHMRLGSSPLSVFNASLIKSLLDVSQDSPNSVLFFFCGQHLENGGPFPGPQGMLRSLTAQLMLKMRSIGLRPSLDFLLRLPGLSSEIYPEDVDISTMCQVFLGLLRQLPFGATVHCIIDGISQFETYTDSWDKELEAVIECLQWIVFNRGATAGVCMKSLLCSAEASTMVCDIIPTENQVDLSSRDYYASIASPEALRTDLSSQMSSRYQ